MPLKIILAFWRSNFQVTVCGGNERAKLYMLETGDRYHWSRQTEPSTF